MFTVIAAENTQHNFQKDISISNQVCTSCHQQPEHDWQRSDHAKSMAVEDKNSVLADFGNVDVEHYGQKAHFFIKENRYQVTIFYDDKTDTYPIKFTFGHFPLQQYLVETEQGKLQVLPFAWDSREKTKVASVGITVIVTKKFAQKTDYIGVNRYKTGMACVLIVTQMV